MIALIVATANPGIRRGGSRFRCAFSPSGWEDRAECIVSCECEVAYSSLAFPLLKVRVGLWCQEANMAQGPDSVVVRFAAVFALAVIILVVMTLAAPPYPAI